MPEITTAGLAGLDDLTSGWAARLLAAGLDVIVLAPSADEEKPLREAVARCWPILQKAGLMPGAALDRLRFTTEPDEAAAAAGFFQAAAGLSGRALADFESRTPADIPIALNGRAPLPAGLRRPERVLIGRPCPPVHLLPLIELGDAGRTGREAIERAAAFYETLGFLPLHLPAGPIAGRLTAALAAEAGRMIAAGSAGSADVAAALARGPALRWLLGLDLPLEDDFEATPTATRQAAEEALLAVMRALRPTGLGAGPAVAARETGRYTRFAHRRWQPGAPVEAPLRLFHCPVDPGWIDYNGHMTEASYLSAFGDASDALFRFVGIDERYRAAGFSFYTVETHLNFLREVGSGEPLTFTTHLLGLDEKRLHFFHQMFHERSGDLLATTEQLLLHVDTAAGRTAPLRPAVRSALAAILDAHQTLPRPPQAGRQSALPRSHP